MSYNDNGNGPAALPPGGYPADPRATKESRRLIRKHANIIGFMLLLVELLMVLFLLGVEAVLLMVDMSQWSLETLDLIDQVEQTIYYVLGFWIPTLILVSWVHIPARSAFPMKKPRAGLVVQAVGICLGASVIGMIASGVLTVFFEMTFDLTPTMPDMPVPVGVGASVLYIFNLAVAPAIFEELLFRGAIMQSLRRFGDGFALVSSAILFSLMHGNLVQGPNAFVLGLAIGYFVLRSGSLVTGMIIHFVNNALSVALSYLSEGMPEQMQVTLNMGVLITYIGLGIVGLVFYLARGGNFQLAPSSYPLSGGRKYSVFFTSATVILFILFILWLTSRSFV